MPQKYYTPAGSNRRRVAIPSHAIRRDAADRSPLPTNRFTTSQPRLPSPVRPDIPPPAAHYEPQSRDHDSDLSEDAPMLMDDDDIARTEPAGEAGEVMEEVDGREMEVDDAEVTIGTEEEGPRDMQELAGLMLAAAMDPAVPADADESAPVAVPDDAVPSEIPVESEPVDGEDDIWEDIDAQNTDAAEPVTHQRANDPLSLAQLAFAMWCERFRIARSVYQSLLEVLPLMSQQDVADLPKSVTTLKRRLVRRLPLVSRRHKELEVAQLKLPSMSAAEKRRRGQHRTADFHWIEPSALIPLLLSSKKFSSRLKQGFGEFVDNPRHLWQAECWQNSVRTTSGKFAHYPDGSPIFPSDFVKFKPDTDSPRPVMGRIYGVGIDRRAESDTKGALMVKIQKLITKEKLNAPWMASVAAHLKNPLRPNELMLCEDRFCWVRPEQIVSRIEDMIIDYDFESDMGSKGPLPRRTHGGSRTIRRVINIGRREIRPAVQSHPHIGELELTEYGRDWYLEQAKNGFISMPYLMFIDGFGLFRNMYRTLTGIYITFAGQTIDERMQRANNFTIGLGPHGSNTNDVLSAIRDLPELDKGMKLLIRGEEKMVMAFPLCYTGDMPQQNANCGILAPTAKRGCRSCLIDKEHKHDQKFDIHKWGRYHYHQRDVRKMADAMTVTERRKWFQEWGMVPEAPALFDISPALDVFNTRPGDVCHSEFAGLGKSSHALLMDAILTETVPRNSPQGSLCGQDRYHHEFVAIPTPTAWRKRQSPKHHLKSWSMSEAGISVLLTPLVFKAMDLKQSDIRPAFWTAVEQNEMLSAEMAKKGWDVVQMVTFIYCAFAWSAAFTCTPVIKKSQRKHGHKIISAGRAFYAELAACAVDAAGSRRRRQAKPSASQAAQQSADEDEYLSEESSDGDDTESQISVASGVSAARAAEGKPSEYRLWASRPNVHQGMHLESMMHRFATPYNCNVLSGEDKHRQWKKWAPNLNNANPVQELISSECVLVTLRLLLDGSFDHEEEELAAMIQELKQKCPRLTEHFSPRSEHETDDDSPSRSLASDKSHAEVKAIGYCDRGHITNKLKLPLWLTGMTEDHQFIVALRDAFAIDYDNPNITNLGGNQLSWYRSVSFTDPKSQRRVTMRTGDCYISTTNEFHRFELGFVHVSRRGEERFFALVSLMEYTSRVDDVIGLRLMVVKAQKIVGLRAIGMRQEYVLDWKYGEHKDTVAHVDGKFHELQPHEPPLPPAFPTIIHVSWRIKVM